jgi:uncharacterized protein
MRFSIGILAASLVCMAGSTLAQTATPGTQQKSPATAQHQPATAAPAPAAAAPGGPAPTLEKPDPAKEAAIRHLMDITQTSKLGDNIGGAITQQVRAVMSRNIQQPEELQKFMDAFTLKFQAAAPASAVTDAEIPIYSHYFTMEDIQGLIKFYESPLGQRVVKSLPEVVQNTQQTGVQMDQKAALEVLQSMSAEYPQLKQMLPPEPGAAPTPGAGPGAGPGGGMPPRSAPGTPAPATPGTPPK